MAKNNTKKTKEEQLDFAALRRRLRAEGPARVYFLYGEEDYLREAFFEEIKKLCVDGECDFNHRRLNGEGLSLTELSEAVNALPFFAERTLVEIRQLELNRFRDSQSAELTAILSDIPDYCTLVLIPPAEYEPDGRLAAFKAVKKYGEAINFTRQGGSTLINWIQRRFAALGKGISRGDAEYLAFISGSLMNRMIPEIEKIGVYARGSEVTREDIDAVAHHLPEARVFEMTEKLASRDFDGAVGILSELMQMKDEPPVKTLAVVGKQMRNLYAARIALDRKLGKSYVSETCGIRFDFVAERLLNSSRGFTETQLSHAVRLCAETDFRMKTGGGDNKELLCELIMRIAAGETA